MSGKKHTAPKEMEMMEPREFICGRSQSQKQQALFKTGKAAQQNKE